MTTRAFYRAAVLLPFVGLVVAAALDRPSALPKGWDWVYPTSITRGLMVYSLLAAWLWIEIGRRPLPEIRRLVWWTPPLYLALGWVLMLGLALIRGAVADMLTEHGGAILLRTAVHLVVGYAYLGLVHLASGVLREGGRLTNPPG